MGGFNSFESSQISLKLYQILPTQQELSLIEETEQIHPNTLSKINNGGEKKYKTKTKVFTGVKIIINSQKAILIPKPLCWVIVTVI